jgi:hypothetical protein
MAHRQNFDDKRLHRSVANKTQAGRLWITNFIYERAEELGVTLKGFEWQFDPSGTDSSVHALVLTGKRQKRVVKLFSTSELEQCGEDRRLQSDIGRHLIRLLHFVGEKRGEAKIVCKVRTCR